MDLQDRRRGALARALARKLGEQAPLEIGGAGESSDAEWSVLDDPQAFESSIEKALSQSGRIVEERTEAPGLLAALLALPVSERETAVVLEPRYQSYTLASYTLERCSKAVFHDPALARELARLARAIVLQTDPWSCGGSAALADLEVYALAMEANALRLAGELRQSLTLFLEARDLQERGGADPDLAARTDLLEASLRRDLRQFPAALSLLSRAESMFSALRDGEQTARTLINRANLFLETHDLDRAVATLKRALPFAQDPWLALCVRHNLISALAGCGHAREAAELYEQSRSFYLQSSDPATASRRIWMEGLIARELGEDLDTARIKLAEAAESLARHGYSFEAALAGLDLVAVYAKQGDSAEVLRVALRLLNLFQMHDVHPEALAALRMVQEAAEREAVNLAVVSRAADMVRANQVRDDLTA
ncbi:MAG TPA: tetratricopeptide repeat protein [Thermoanaerobaculia bacterium]